MQEVFRIRTRVADIKLEKQVLGSYRTNEIDESGKPVYATQVKELGWFVLFEGSRERLFLSPPEIKPELEIGQAVVITIATVTPIK